MQLLNDSNVIRIQIFDMEGVNIVKEVLFNGNSSDETSWFNFGAVRESSDWAIENSGWAPDFYREIPEGNLSKSPMSYFLAGYHINSICKQRRYFFALRSIHTTNPVLNDCFWSFWWEGMEPDLADTVFLKPPAIYYSPEENAAPKEMLRLGGKI